MITFDFCEPPRDSRLQHLLLLLLITSGVIACLNHCHLCVAQCWVCLYLVVKDRGCLGRSVAAENPVTHRGLRSDKCRWRLSRLHITHRSVTVIGMEVGSVGHPDHSRGEELWLQMFFQWMEIVGIAMKRFHAAITPLNQPQRACLMQPTAGGCAN